MKTSKRYLLPLTALLALAGCSDDDTTAGSGSNGFRILASIDGTSGLTDWQPGDQIKVVSGDELYTFVTETGGAAAEFTDRDNLLSADLAASGPVSAYHECTSMYGTFRIQTEQTVNDGVNTARVPMFAYTMNTPEQNRMQLAFQPLASVLELTVEPYDITVSQLTIAPAEEATVSGGAMAGGFTVNAAQNTVAINNGINSLVLRFNGGLNLSEGATLRILIGWFAVEGGLTFTFRYGTKDYTSTIWADDGVVRTFTDNNGFKQARLMRETFEFDANSFPRAYYVKTGGTAAGKGLSWDAPTTLASALRNAMSGSTIHIAAGTYSPEDILTGAGETEGSRTFEIARNVTLIGGYPADAAEGAAADPAANATILDGGGKSFHTVVVSAPQVVGEKVVMRGLTIRGGRNTVADEGTAEINGVNLSDNYAAGVAVVGARAELIGCTITENEGNSAAGLFAVRSELTVADSRIVGNTAAANGGGAWITTGTDLTMSGTTIGNNRTTGSSAVAAGLYLYAPAGASLDAELSGCDITGNATAGGAAGGMYIRDDSGDQSLKAAFSDCRITGNKGAMGAAFQMLNARATFSGCRISDNEASGNGLVYITTTGSANADALFDKCTVSDNTTTGSAVASGLYIYNNGGAIDVVVTNSTFSGNATAGRGGAIYARNNQSGDVNVTCANSTFAANRSGSYGGAIALYGAAAKKVNVSLVSCTLTGNDDTHATALGGGVGLETAGLSLTTANSIISGNTANAAVSDVFVKSGITAAVKHQNSIVGDKFYDASGAEQSTSPVFTASTMLAELADNGGATKTCKLIGNASTNFAFGNGMTVAALKALASDDISADVLGSDQTGAVRSDTDRMIGACVKK